MLNLVVLTIDHPTTRYLVNKISADFSIDAVFLVENQGVSDIILQGIGLPTKNPRGFPSKIFLFVNSFLKVKLDPPEHKKKQLYDEVLGDSWQELKNQNVIKIRRRNFNTHETAMEIQKYKPEIILTSAVPILGTEIISSARKFCLNLHKGITPYYRGTNCLLWPLYNGEPDCVGVTVHQVNERIDSGLVANQVRYKLEPGDTPFSIDLKSMKLGTELMKKTLREIQDGDIMWVEQDLSQGRVYHMKEFTVFKKLEVIKRLRKMCFPKRKR